MSHADAAVLATRDELRARGFAVSRCLVIEDDPAGDFGIAWYFGIDRTTKCARMAYDVGYLPTKHTVVHEFGHDMHAKWWAQGILEEFWALVGFPVSIDDAGQQSQWWAGQGNEYQAWRRRPTEIIAELFAWTVLGDLCITETFGVPLSNDLRTALTVFFARFKEEMDMALAQEDRDEIRKIVAEEVNRRFGIFEVNLIRELIGAIKSGFNVTLPTLLNRLARGDKDVTTDPIDSAHATPVIDNYS